VGAEVLTPEATSFRVWAPNCRQIEVVVLPRAGKNIAAAAIAL
jgi:hypothetical protein